MGRTRRVGLIVGGLILALVGYYLPWFTHATAGFTMNGFDLAEWSSLHPAVRASSPPLLTSFLLRFPHAALAVGLALAANGLPDLCTRWGLRGLAALLALRLVPPADFLTSASRDPNYRQMALLAGLGLAAVLGAALLERTPQRWQGWALATLLLVSLLAGWTGFSRAGTLLDNFEIGVETGAGIIVWSAAALAGALLAPSPSGAVSGRRSARPKELSQETS